jgi:hypothetical protein
MIEIRLMGSVSLVLLLVGIVGTYCCYVPFLRFATVLYHDITIISIYVFALVIDILFVMRISNPFQTEQAMRAASQLFLLIQSSTVQNISLY